MEKRTKKRYPKRLFVRFGKEKPDHIGFTQDISAAGIFVKSNFSFPPSTRLKVELTLPDETIIECSGIVQWAKKVPPALSRLVKKNGMGIVFSTVPTSYKALIEMLKLD